MTKTQTKTKSPRPRPVRVRVRVRVKIKAQNTNAENDKNINPLCFNARKKIQATKLQPMIDNGEGLQSFGNAPLPYKT
jgi:hypothetical protein